MYLSLSDTLAWANDIRAFAKVSRLLFAANLLHPAHRTTDVSAGVMAQTGIVGCGMDGSAAPPAGPSRLRKNPLLETQSPRTLDPALRTHDDCTRARRKPQHGHSILAASFPLVKVDEVRWLLKATHTADWYFCIRKSAHTYMHGWISSLSPRVKAATGVECVC